MMQRFSRLDVVVFGGILLLGLARLPSPFTGDQALNLLLGRLVADGGALYVDLWDLKHPGIFFFFAAGGRLFGFTEIGIHLFELLWMLTLALAVRVAAAHFLNSRAALSIAPVLTVGFYYAAAGDYHLTQTEALVGLPLLLSLTCVVSGVRSGDRRRIAWLFASGVFAGIVLVFKAPYIVLPCIFWVAALNELRRGHPTGITSDIRALAPPLAAGALLPLSASVAYLASQHALGMAWWTFTVHPRQAATETGIVDVQLLYHGSVWFVRTFGALLILAAIGALSRVKRGWNLLPIALIAWLLGGLVLCLMQVIGWYSYHYFLVLVPIGLLATDGAVQLWAAVAGAQVKRLWRFAAVIALAGSIAIGVPPVWQGARTVGDVLRARPIPLDSDSARRYQSEHDAAYAGALEATSFLRAPGSHPGPIYVFGNPIHYVLAGRAPAISTLATWFHPTDTLWHRMMDELTAALPEYILVEDGALESFASDNPSLASDVGALRSWLDQHYEIHRTDAGATWLLRRDQA